MPRTEGKAARLGTKTYGISVVSVVSVVSATRRVWALFLENSVVSVVSVVSEGGES
jgi:hypothetical protein